ncbi:MAG TPA: SDR family oxidoreductase [Solirubrobacteraceae bacterium]|nr:SDR family oxidoreductase [Solirubrobacteraceae bacterium]
MPGSKEGRVALITGSAASIGQAYAQRLAEDGAKIVVCDVADASETIELVRAAGSEAIGVKCDVSSADDVAAAAAAAFDAFGKVDIVVHNAAIYPIAMFADMTFVEWKRVLEVNVDSLFHLGHEFFPGMRERGWGRVVCIASNTFHAGIGGMSHYVTSKGGVIGFVRALAAELGEDGVTINAVAPSLVRSQGTSQGVHDEMGLFEYVASLQAIKRTEVPADLVGAISFLSSDDAGFITGQTLPVDGGWVRV